MATMRRIIDDPVPSPRSYNPAIPAEAEAVLARILAKDPNQRYQTGNEFGVALEALLRGLADQSRRRLVRKQTGPRPEARSGRIAKSSGGLVSLDAAVAIPPLNKSAEDAQAPVGAASVAGSKRPLLIGGLILVLLGLLAIGIKLIISPSDTGNVGYNKDTMALADGRVQGAPGTVQEPAVNKDSNGADTQAKVDPGQEKTKEPEPKISVVEEKKPPAAKTKETPVTKTAAPSTKKTEESQPPAPLPLYSVSGSVTDADGNALPDVLIVSTTGKSARTRNDGSFQLDGLQGETTISAKSSGFVFSDLYTVSSARNKLDFTGE